MVFFGVFAIGMMPLGNTRQTASQCLLSVKPVKALIEQMSSASAGSEHADGRARGVEIGQRDVIQAEWPVAERSVTEIPRVNSKTSRPQTRQSRNCLTYQMYG